MNKPQKTWTKESPKETGWYMARFCDDLPSEPVLVASSRLEGFLVRTWNGDCRTVDAFCNLYSDAQWLRIDIPALPEEGETT